MYWKVTEGLLGLWIRALALIFSNINITKKRSEQYLTKKHSGTSHLDKQRRGNIQI